MRAFQRCANASGCNAAGELRRRNRGSELGTRTHARRVDHISCQCIDRFPWHGGNQGERVGQQKNDRRQSAALAGKTGHHQCHFRFGRAFVACLVGRASLGLGMTVATSAARRLLMWMAGSVRATVPNFTELHLIVALVRGGDDKIGGGHTVLACPSDLLLVDKATTMVPALVGTRAAAGPILAWKGPRAVLLRAGFHHRNPSDSDHETDQKNDGGRLPREAFRLSEPHAHGQDAASAAEVFNQLYSAQILGHQDTCLPTTTSNDRRYTRPISRGHIDRRGIWISRPGSSTEFVSDLSWLSRHELTADDRMPREGPAIELAPMVGQRRRASERLPAA